MKRFSHDPHPPIDSIHSGQPLRDRRPAELVHPFLRDVKFTLHAHEVCGIVDGTKADVNSASDNNRKKFLPLTQSNKLIESTPAASPAAGGASDGGDS